MKATATDKEEPETFAQRATRNREAEVERMNENADESDPVSDSVNHPPHYNVGGIEVIDAIEAWRLDFNRGNVVKYVARAGRKGGRETELEDLRKAEFYLKRAIALLEEDTERASDDSDSV